MFHTVDLFIVPELSMHVVLGMPWLRCYNPTIDWVAGRVTLSGGSSVLDGIVSGRCRDSSDRARV